MEKFKSVAHYTFKWKSCIFQCKKVKSSKILLLFYRALENPLWGTSLPHPFFVFVPPQSENPSILPSEMEERCAPPNFNRHKAHATLGFRVPEGAPKKEKPICKDWFFSFFSEGTRRGAVVNEGLGTVRAAESLARRQGESLKVHQNKKGWV